MRAGTVSGGLVVLLTCAVAAGLGPVLRATEAGAVLVVSTVPTPSVIAPDGTITLVGATDGGDATAGSVALSRAIGSAKASASGMATTASCGLADASVASIGASHANTSPDVGGDGASGRGADVGITTLVPAALGASADQVGFGADAIAATLPSRPLEVTPTATSFPAKVPREEKSPLGARLAPCSDASRRARSAELSPGCTERRKTSWFAVPWERCSVPASMETPR